jgi:DNA polymerase III alpha subunit
MQNNQYGEIIMEEHDLCDLIMQGQDLAKLDHVIVSSAIDLDQLKLLFQDSELIKTWTVEQQTGTTIAEYDTACQQNWYMPESYQQLDIAEHILNLCTSDAALQRCGQELMLYQQKGLFDLLRYLKYLVDTMKANNIIWGVGRGSSVASYVLYLLGVHRIDSMFYDLDINEFLR